MFLIVLLLQLNVFHAFQYFTGTPVGPSKYRFVVRIKVRQDDNPRELKLHCAGVIVDERHVIAPAHCFLVVHQNGTITQINPKSIAVVDRFKAKNIRRIVGTRKHPNFTYAGGIFEHNIALIILSEELNIFNARMQSVKMYIEKRMFIESSLKLAYEDMENKNVLSTVLGWTHNNRGIDILVMKYVSFLLSKPCIKMMCRWNLPWCKTSIDTRICLKMENKMEDSCSVDAGGVLVQGQYFIGILSWKPSCDYLGPPLLFSNLKEIFEFLAIYNISLNSGSVKYGTSHNSFVTFQPILLSVFHLFFRPH